MILGLLPINPILEIVIFVVAGILVLGGIITGIIFLLRFQKRKSMYQHIDSVLNDYVKTDMDNRSFERVNSEDYDYILNTKRHVYYIMIIPYAASLEITINSPIKWQYKRGEFDNGERFLPRVDKLMRCEIENEIVGKDIKKLYIVYPNAKSILRQINDCEMEFVRPNTDINGTNVITYNELISYLELL